MKYLQKYHSKTGRRRLFKTLAKDPTIKKTTFKLFCSIIISKQIAEEERRVILDMNSIDLENNLMNSSYLVLLLEEFFNE